MRSTAVDGAAGSRRTAGESFVDDDRAIEGLPIRLVIALTVGVAALALMLNMLGGIGDVGDTEVTVEIDDDDQVIEQGNAVSVSMDVIDENGNDVEDATVLVSAGSAQLDGVAEAQTGEDEADAHEAIVDLDDDDFGLRADQDMGTLEIDVVPPSDSNYIDEQPNPEIIVTEG
ncbi:DUF7382 domain-containing protein [Natronobacterium gregoryi]|uniref:DUF7382 domain-containing protein n=2 Tax=Natronobacterium gregoryi TaxID=44930 RepID=L0AGJ8_NATGS|nr:hypothetical protein [Natronobacterium gregoryi]AFZ72544.1 hypothetical protein Natgr_1327 [Natronobacterium gregoryi SP2]ELY74154.1 hypothetical protein C490_00595 [Natronobacterium gregoryi SP2]PLK21512.1 hypothetical protein CYV19_04285 [Natronobacterium gregoryi SP2]SFI75871.1 hypothetical protein SAMN05443661_10514 [Natronobacterium gregoryi]